MIKGFTSRLFRFLSMAIIMTFCLSACQNNKAVKNAEVFKNSELNSKKDINFKLVTAAQSETAESQDLIYLLGTGDVIVLTVFQVEQLNTTLRVNGKGNIILPLLGTIKVKGKSLSEVENIIVEKLAADYLKDPQVSLFVEEYRSQQITVMGAVLKPDVYSVRQSRSIFEMLSLAGGLSPTASDTIRVKTVQQDPLSGLSAEHDLVLSVSSLLEGSEGASSLRLRGGDSILVPKAGVVFIDGAVKKPGSFIMQGETNVMKAIAMAGGIEWAGKEKRVQVIRSISGKPYAIDVDLTKIRNQKGDDVILKDGDIVAVNYSKSKRFVSGFFKAAGQIFGYNLNAN